MLDFTIFGIPVRVEPWFWLTGFFLGGGFSHLQNGDYVSILVWLVIIFFSILVHELGHALVGLKEGGGAAWIRLWAFGGLAYNQGGRYTRAGRAKMIAAGPLAGIGLYILTCLSAIIIWPHNGVGLDMILFCSSLGNYVPDNPELYNIIIDTPTRFNIFRQLIWINLFWSLINFFPVFPLDGGQFMELFMRSRKKMHMIGTVVGAGLAVFGLWYFGSYFMAVLFGLLAFQNYQGYQQSRY